MMANKHFKELVNQQIEIFKYVYANVKDIYWDEEKNRSIHNLEYGQAREEVTRKLLRLFIAPQCQIDSGFIINHQGEVSNQCDIILYAAGFTPLIHNTDGQKFFPIGEHKNVGGLLTLTS